MSGAKIALILALALIVTAIGLVLSSSPITVIGANSVTKAEPIGYTTGNISGCQEVGTFPRDTSAIRLSIAANVGPRVSVAVLSGSHMLTRGERQAGWGADETVTVAVHALPFAVSNARICTTLGRAIEHISLHGTPAGSSAPSNNGGSEGIELRMEYLRPGPISWASLVASVSRKLGWGHAASGSWIVFLLLAIMISLVALTSYLTIEEMR
jgi:hypothetical protein